VTKRPISRPADSRSNPSRVRNFVIWGLVIAAIAALGLILYLNLRSPGEIEGLVHFTGLSRVHDNSLQYDGLDNPPTGGAHYDRWQNCGVYEEPIQTGNAIHSLEHGAVWITYNNRLAQDDIARLQDRVATQSFLLLSPFPEQTSPLTLTAWGVQLELDSATDARLDQFIERYRLGATTPELGASCEGGVGQPAA
jgi:hypothetical protein